MFWSWPNQEASRPHSGEATILRYSSGRLQDESKWGSDSPGRSHVQQSDPPRGRGNPRKSLVTHNREYQLALKGHGAALAYIKERTFICLDLGSDAFFLKVTKHHVRQVHMEPLWLKLFNPPRILAGFEFIAGILVGEGLGICSIGVQY